MGPPDQTPDQSSSTDFSPAPRTSNGWGAVSTFFTISAMRAGGQKASCASQKTKRRPLSSSLRAFRSTRLDSSTWTTDASSKPFLMRFDDTSKSPQKNQACRDRFPGRIKEYGAPLAMCIGSSIPKSRSRNTPFLSRMADSFFLPIRYNIVCLTAASLTEWRS